MEPTPSCRAVLAEDHIFVRQLIVNLAKTSQSLRIVAQEETLGSALHACQANKANLLLLSIALLRRGGQEIAPLLEQARAKHPILAYCNSCTTEGEVVRAIRLGITGCVGINTDVDEFLNAIGHVSRGETYFCRLSSKILAEVAIGGHSRARGSDKFSARELEVLRMICDGRTSKQIARVLGLSVATVNTHRRNVMAKAGAHNAADLIRYARKQNLIELHAH